MDEIKDIQNEINDPNNKIDASYRKHLLSRLDKLKEYMSEDFEKVKSLVGEYQAKLEKFSEGDKNILGKAFEVVGQMEKLLQSAQQNVDALKRQVEGLSAVVQKQNDEIVALRGQLEARDKVSRKENVLSFVDTIVEYAQKRYPNDPKLIAMQTIRDNLKQANLDDPQKFEETLKINLEAFLVICMQKRTGLTMFSKLTDTGKFAINLINQGYAPMKNIIKDLDPALGLKAEIKYSDLAKVLGRSEHKDSQTIALRSLAHSIPDLTDEKLTVKSRFMPGKS